MNVDTDCSTPCRQCRAGSQGYRCRCRNPWCWHTTACTLHCSPCTRQCLQHVT